MSTLCNVAPYEGNKGFLVVWSSAENSPQAATVCEVLSRDGYRIWFQNQAVKDVQLINEKLSACCGLIALYSERSVAQHDFRKVVTAAVLKKKPIAAVLLGNVQFSFGMLTQLRDSPRASYEKGMLFGQDFQKHFATAKGAENPSVAVEWRPLDENLEIKPIDLSEGEKWPVSVLDEKYEIERLQELQKDSQETPFVTVVQIASERIDIKNSGCKEKLHQCSDDAETDEAQRQTNKAEINRDSQIAGGVGKTALLEVPPYKGRDTVIMIEYAPKLLRLDTGEIFQCRTEVTSIGRGESCDIQLDVPTVSMLHARVKSKFASCVPVNSIEDCKSSNGTWVNGKRLGAGESVEGLEGTAELKCGPHVHCLVAFGEASLFLTKGMTIAWLRCVETGETKFILEDHLALGSKYDWANHSLNECHISWEHAVLNRMKEGFGIVDTNSTNGVYRNGRRIPVGEAELLSDGDELRLGLRHFVFSIRKLI